MKIQKLQLLEDVIAHLQQAAEHLQYSQQRTHQLSTQTSWTPEELERLESLCSRFARLSDILTQKLLRLIDELELNPEGTLLDRIQRAEKRGWVANAGELIQIRELRNLMAHE